MSRERHAAPPVLTIGHSTHSLSRFRELLTEHDVKALVDIRRFPGSRKFPHFNQDNLAAAMVKAGVEYRWLEALGGRRRKPRDAPESTNLGLRHPMFRNYADYMLTDEFRHGVHELLEIVGARRTAIMCAEAVYWRCHRRLVSDFLTANSVTVEHIMPTGDLRPHKLTEGAVLDRGRVGYPG